MVLFLVIFSSCILATFASNVPADDEIRNETRLLMGANGLWQYAYLPNTTCTNCTVIFETQDSSAYSLEAYLILHGDVNFGLEETSDFLKIYLGNDVEPLGTLTELAENYNSTGTLEPLIVSDSSIRFENYYPEGLSSVFTPKVEFFIRLRYAGANCSRPLVYAFPAYEEITIPAMTLPNLSEKCYVTIYPAGYDPSPKITLYNWILQEDEKVSIIPGFSDILYNSYFKYVAVTISYETLSLYNELFITARRVNLMTTGSSSIFLQCSNKKPSDYGAKKLVKAGDKGFFMGSYPDYGELEVVSKSGDNINAVITIAIARLKNDSKMLITSGRDGQPQQSYSSTDIAEQQVSFISDQFNVKFTPGNDAESAVILQYSIENGVCGGPLPIAILFTFIPVSLLLAST